MAGYCGAAYVGFAGCECLGSDISSISSSSGNCSAKDFCVKVARDTEAIMAPASPKAENFRSLDNHAKARIIISLENKTFNFSYLLPDTRPSKAATAFRSQCVCCGKERAINTPRHLHPSQSELISN
eukprot:191949-Amorphochlora_amoeboformis.AAC.2